MSLTGSRSLGRQTCMRSCGQPCGMVAVTASWKSQRPGDRDGVGRPGVDETFSSLGLFVRFDIDQYIDYEAAASQLLRICEA